MLFFLKQQIININYYSGQSNNLWVEFKSGHSGVAQGFQLTVLSVQGEELWILQSKYYYFLEELGYLVDAIINTGDMDSFDSDKEAGKLSHEDKILLSRWRGMLAVLTFIWIFPNLDFCFF